MFYLVSTVLVINFILIIFRLIYSKKIHEKICCFYFIFGIFILLIIEQAVSKFDLVLDIIIMLFLLKLMTILFLLSKKKKYD